MILKNTKTHHKVNSRENESIFDCFAAEGHTMPHGCLSGTCGACVITVESGSHHLSTPSVIESSTLNQIKNHHPHLAHHTLRLSCRARVMEGSSEQSKDDEICFHCSHK